MRQRPFRLMLLLFCAAALAQAVAGVTQPSAPRCNPGDPGYVCTPCGPIPTGILGN